TGTGKELAARAIHMASGRGALPMVSVNCAALPATLLEAELFGHARGAFTGAVNQRIGRFEQAHRGTIFLDEIGEIPLELQAKLLRVLQEREIQRVGSSETIRLDFRVIAASNIDLEEAVRKQRFRQDLLYRLNVAPLHMPRLRDRISDIPVLVDHFLDRICRQEGLPVKQSSREAVEHLSSYHWPGNVRQLEHKVEKAIAFSGERRQLYPVDFPLPEEAKACPAIPETMLDVPETGIDFDQMISGIERAVLGQALAKSGGNKARAASLLGMKRTTLLSKVKALSLEAS
ncbi:MAG: sigma 54-interacting transcriptional regulator, partial [Candidatus Solibacter usitatus]|nr:sigma 54-interacting transcriptional regulator [Candidatus Solibacter usitatus]